MIHPDIKVFWKLEVYKEGPWGNPGSEYFVWYISSDNSCIDIIIAREYIDGSKMEYSFDNKTYTESEMLTIVRCKAFL